jgi:hypothetical protein
MNRFVSARVCEKDKKKERRVFGDKTEPRAFNFNFLISFTIFVVVI